MASGLSSSSRAQQFFSSQRIPHDFLRSSGQQDSPTQPTFSMLTLILSLVAALCLDAAAALQLPLDCTSQSQPNPIAATYPDLITGTINGTLAVLPIPLEEAQQIVGSKYTILTSAYRELLPDFPEDMYPAVLQAVQDHDVQAGGIHIPDFTRISIEYPFLDLLNDSHTSFRLALNQTLTASSPGLVGSAAYGTRVYPAAFDPPCDAYSSPSSSSSSSSSDDDDDDSSSLTARPFLSPSPNTTAGVYFALSFHPVVRSGGVVVDDDDDDEAPYPLSFFVNVTNQPSFANPARGCDRQVRMFDTVLTQPPHEPVDVEGTVWAADPFFPSGGRAWDGVRGVRLDTAFIEYNYLQCETLAGL